MSSSKICREIGGLCDARERQMSDTGNWAEHLHFSGVEQDLPVDHIFFCSVDKDILRYPCHENFHAHAILTPCRMSLNNGDSVELDETLLF